VGGGALLLRKKLLEGGAVEGLAAWRHGEKTWSLGEGKSYPKKKKGPRGRQKRTDSASRFRRHATSSRKETFSKKRKASQSKKRSAS